MDNQLFTGHPFLLISPSQPPGLLDCLKTMRFSSVLGHQTMPGEQFAAQFERHFRHGFALESRSAVRGEELDVRRGKDFAEIHHLDEIEVRIMEKKSHHQPPMTVESALTYSIIKNSRIQDKPFQEE